MALEVLSKTVGTLAARNWIGGEWVEAERKLESINPATGEVIGTYADGGAREAELAISAAKAAFDTTDWRWNRRLRARALNEMADVFEARIDDLVRIGVEEGPG